MNTHNFKAQHIWDEESGWIVDCVRWEERERVLGKREYKKLIKWMFGQTCAVDGVYIWDLANFLKGGKSYD